MADREQHGTHDGENQGRFTETQSRASTVGATRGRRTEGNGGTRGEGAPGAEGRAATEGESRRGGEQGLAGDPSRGEGEERRPRHGAFYASAIRRISQRPRSGFGGTGLYGREGGERAFGYGGSGRFPEEGQGSQGYRGGFESGYRGGSSGFSESSFGQGGGYGGQGAYGSQYIRGTGGQSGERLGYGGGGSDFGPTELERGRSYGRTGLEGREWQERERGRGRGEWQENRERYDRQGGEGRLQDRDFGVGSRFEEGRWGGGSQITGAERRGWGEGRGEERGWSGGYGTQGWRGERGESEIRERQPGESWRSRGERGEMETERRRRGRWQREPLTAREIMTREVKAVTKQSTLKNVAQIMKDENCGIVPIVDEDHKLLGVVTDRDLVIRSLAGDKSPLECKVEDVMTDDVHAVTPDEELRDVIDLMGREQVRRVPVVDRDDRLVGIIAMADIANRADYDDDLQEALEDISSKRSFWSRLWS